jgi:NAD(P)-dependent dehydrogenase (short-subunit alcohol dehydrogenase family)
MPLAPSATVASRRNRSPAAAEAALGHVDVLVCSAGVAGLNAMTDYPIEEWKKVFDVSTGAVFDISGGRATYSAVGRLPSRSHGQVSVTLRKARRRWTRCARKRCGAPDDGSRFGSSRRLPGLEGRRARCFGRSGRPACVSGSARCGRRGVNARAAASPWDSWHGWIRKEGSQRQRSVA